MGKYADSVLVKGEKVVYETKLHWIVYSLPALCAVMVFWGLMNMNVGLGESSSAYFDTVHFIASTCMSIPVFLILSIPAVIRRKTSEFVVTSNRVIIKTGLIARHTFDTKLQKIEGLVVKQGIIGRILNYGTIIVRGTGGGSQPFKSVDDPLRLKKVIDETLIRSDRL